MEQHWKAEQFSNIVKRDATTWGLRYDPTPGGRKNADGSTSYSLAIPALLLTENVGDLEDAAVRIAGALNEAPTLAAENAALKALVAEMVDCMKACRTELERSQRPSFSWQRRAAALIERIELQRAKEAAS